MNAELQDGYRRCRQITRAHARSFYAAAFCLDPVRRRSAMALYTFLARLRGVNSYGPRYIEQLLFPHERALLEATVVARPEREEVRRAARGLWEWTRYVWRETERVLGGALPIPLDEDGLLSAVDRIYAWR